MRQYLRAALFLLIMCSGALTAWDPAIFFPECDPGIYRRDDDTETLADADTDVNDDTPSTDADD